MNTHTRAILVLLLITGLGTLPVAAQSLKGEEPGRSKPIPWAEIGSRAGAEYNGEGVSIVPGEDGAVLHSVFQRLRGDATPEGLWLTSTAEGREADRFRVVATKMGRTTNRALPTTGDISTDGSFVRFIRPGLIEEYSTSVDGVRQDFLVLKRPEGKGELRVELAVDGARAEEAGFGARLVLKNSRRHIAYRRLHVEDAEGSVLPARIEVVSGDRLAILVADADAVYPVRIDPTFSDENWISMGGLPGANGGVYAAVAAEDGTLIVGGSFSVIGDVTANYIARWDGTSWLPLGSGLNGRVLALAVSGGELYAGGWFTTAGGVSANRVARWDGNSWSALGSGMNGSVAALAVSGGELYAGGDFTMAGETSANRVARWDGNSWSALGSGMDGGVDALAVSGGDLYAGGSFTMAGETSANRIARWDGGSWFPLGSGMNDAVSALAASSDYLYVGGAFTAVGEVSANSIARWDGSSWFPLGLGMDGSVLALAVFEDDLYAGGYFTTAGEVSASRIARWDGSSWSALGSGMDGTPRGPASVHALAVSGGDLYAGGRFTTAGRVSANNIARWDGTSWSPLGSGLNGRVVALAVFGNDLYAGGEFTMAGEVSANRIARWDGSSWSGLEGMNGRVRALAVSGSDLYAGGNFTIAGEVSASGIARWDGSSWSALGEGIDGDGFALAISGDNVYTVGRIPTVGGEKRPGVYRWDGNSWSVLGSGTNGLVRALAVYEDDLYAGGDFTIVGGKVSAYLTKTDIAVWLSDGTVAEPSQPGTVVGILSAIEIDEATSEPTVFTLVSGPGDDDNAFFTIEGDQLKTAVAFDYDLQDLFTIRVRATYADGTEKEKVFLLRVDRDGFLVWAEELPPDQRGEADDPGDHGLPNLLRYAFGMDPIAPDRGALPRPVLSEMTVEGESRIHLTLLYTRRADDPDLIFIPESSEDLDTWTPLVSAEEISGSDGTTETVIVTDPEPVDAKPKRFLRVRVERDD